MVGDKPLEIDPWAFCKAGLVESLDCHVGGGVRSGLDLARLQFPRIGEGAVSDDAANGDSNALSSEILGGHVPVKIVCTLLKCVVRGWVGCPTRMVSSVLGEYCLRIEGQAKLVLPCEVCQGPMELLLPFARTLVLKSIEQQADIADQNLPEDVDAIVSGCLLDMQDLIEDEILLSMPMYPRHESCPSGAEELVQTQKPFASLVDLLSVKSK